MIGLPGPVLRDEDIRLFQETRAASLILYRRNFQLRDMLSWLRFPLDQPDVYE